MKYEWIPKVRVGPLKFNSAISPYVENGTLIPAPFDDDINNLGNTPGEDRYTYPDDDETDVYVENGQIESIACYNQCVLRGRNLIVLDIGLDYERVRELIGSEPACGPTIQPVINELQEVYEFEVAGAQIWVKARKVVSIFCHDGSE